MAHGIVFCPRLRQRRHRHRHRRHHPSSLQNLPRHHRYRVIVIFVVMSSCRHVVMSSCHRPPSPPSPLPGGGPWRQRHHRDFGLLVCCAEASSISRPISRQPVTPPLLPGVSASALFLQPPPAPTQPGSPFSLRPATSSRVPQCSRRPRGPPPTPGPKCAILAGPLTMQPPTPALPPKAAVSGLRFHAILLSGLAGQAGR